MNRAEKSDARLAAAMVVLSPLLICQGMYVRRVTPKLPEAEGPRSGEAGSGALLRLLVLGDSAAAGVGVRTQKEALAGYMVNGLKRKFRVAWRVEAQTGATTRSTIARLKNMAQEPFAAIAISLGVNDVTCGRRATAWLAELDELAGLLRRKFGAQRMLWSGLPPMHEFPALPQPLRWYLGARAKWFDRMLRGWTEAHPDCVFVAAPAGGCGPMMAEDGFHPGPRMYEIWGVEMARRIMEVHGLASHEPAAAQAD
jgi:lysophospholipase L1-like esterase